MPEALLPLRRSRPALSRPGECAPRGRNRAAGPRPTRDLLLTRSYEGRLRRRGAFAWRPGRAAITARARTAPFPASNAHFGTETAMTETIDATLDGLHPGDIPQSDRTDGFDLGGQPSERA